MMNYGNCAGKIMYANKKAESAGDEINAMEDAKLFKDYNSLGNRMES